MLVSCWLQIPVNVEASLRRDGLGLRDDPKGPLFRTIPNRGGQLTRTPPAPGECLRYDPPARGRAAMANPASTRTTPLYDRRRDEMSLDEVERISI